MPRPLAAAAGLALLAAPAAAAECTADKAGADLGHEEAAALYDCLADAMVEGYRQGEKRWIPAEFVDTYRAWGKAVTGPAAPGFHGGRFLLTWVNEAGYDEYVKYDTESAEMPVGTVIAKESFEVSDTGEATPGPLFIMQKVELEKTPETDGWYYMMVAPNGEPQAVPVMTACNECHANFGDAQDHLGYPVEDVRVSN
ncbi:MAG TPA: cytochrome P460 family protein [Thermohalobaculum sp.]|nr:cytochrome P460 family protein [Thermohalobaculum sp.]